MTAWMDTKVVHIMSTASDATAITMVQRRLKTGERLPVPCPQCVEDYNCMMGGVDSGDQQGGIIDALPSFINSICKSTLS